MINNEGDIHKNVVGGGLRGPPPPSPNRVKEVEQGTSCAAAVRKYGIAKQSLFNWIKDKSKIFAAVEANNLVNLSMFAENNQIGGLVMRVSRIAEIELVATLLLRRLNKVLCIYTVYVTIFC